MREPSAIIFDFYKWLNKPLKYLAFKLKRNESEYRDMNGRKIKIGDTIILHRHDPAIKGADCKHDLEFKVEHDDWGRVGRKGCCPIYLNWLIEVKSDNS